MTELVFQIEEVNDPFEVAQCKAQDERARRNERKCLRKSSWDLRTNVPHSPCS